MYLAKRKNIYHLFYKDDQGKQKSVTTKCKFKSDANKFLSQFQKQLKDKKSLDRKISLKEYHELYKKYASSRFSTSYQKLVGYAFEQFSKVLDPEILLNEIKVYHIEKFVQLKLSEAKEHIVNGYLRALQGAFQRATEFGYLDENVFKKIKKLKVVQNSPAYVNFEDLNKILQKEKDSTLQLIYLVGFYTGMRMGEIRFTKWKSINFSTNIISVKNHEEFTTKSKLERIIPLHKKIRELLLAYRKSQFQNEYVFMRDGKVLTKDFISARFKKAVRDAEVSPELHFHSLRHGFASNLILKGVSIYEVSKLLGHAEIKTTQIYAHLRSENLINAVELLD